MSKYLAIFTVAVLIFILFGSRWARSDEYDPNNFNCFGAGRYYAMSKACECPPAKMHRKKRNRLIAACLKPR